MKRKKSYSEKNPPNYYGLWVPILMKKPFYSKRKKTQSLHGPWVVNLILSYGFYWVAFKTFSSWIVELIEKLEKIKKNVRTWGWETACFRVMVLWRGVTHFCFLLDKYFAKKLLYHIVAMIVLKRFRIATHCWAASSSIKTFFVKLTTFSTV